MRSSIKYFIVPVLIFTSLACSGLANFQPTTTPQPTATLQPTVIPTTIPPTATSSPSSLLTTAGNVPDGFSVQQIAGFPLAVLIPEDWYFLQEQSQGVDAFFVTRESIETHGRFSTGLTVNIIQQDLETIDVDASASGYIEAQASAETTTQVILSDQVKSNDGSLHLYLLVVEATLPVDPKDPVPSPEKTLLYQAIADLKTGLIYLMIFETPRETWEDEFSNRGSALVFSVTELIFEGR